MKSVPVFKFWLAIVFIFDFLYNFNELKIFATGEFRHYNIIMFHVKILTIFTDTVTFNNKLFNY